MVVLDGGVRLDDEKRLDARRLVAGLFAQLAKGRVLRCFARVDHAAGDLERQRLAPEAVLPDEDDLVLRRDGDDVAPIVAANREGVTAVSSAAILELHPMDIEHAKAARRLVADPPPRSKCGRWDNRRRLVFHVRYRAERGA